MFLLRWNCCEILEDYELMEKFSEAEDILLNQSDVKCKFYMPDIPLSSADYTIIPLVVENIILGSNLLWGEFSTLSAAIDNH